MLVCKPEGRDHSEDLEVFVNLKGRDHSEDLEVDGKIILKWVLGKYSGKVWTGLIRLRIGTRGGHGNEPSRSIEDR
jgi:hypothetical protein